MAEEKVPDEERQSQPPMVEGRVDATLLILQEIGGLRSEMRSEIKELRSEMRSEIGGLRSEMKSEIGGLRSEIGGLRSEMKSEIGGLRSEMDQRFAQIEHRFAGIDQKFARVDARLDFVIGLTATVLLGAITTIALIVANHP